MIVMDVRSWVAVVLPVTFKLPLVITVAPVGDSAEAVMVVVPAEIDVASPEVVIVPICTLLDFHVAVGVKSCVRGGRLKLPIAWNCVGAPVVTVDVAGISVIDTRSRVPLVCPDPALLTATLALATMPENADAPDAVIVTVPAPTPVTVPAVLTVATALLDDSHVTWDVMSFTDVD
jgi:hypothetical protein